MSACRRSGVMAGRSRWSVETRLAAFNAACGLLGDIRQGNWTWLTRTIIIHSTSSSYTGGGKTRVKHHIYLPTSTIGKVGLRLKLKRGLA